MGEVNEGESRTILPLFGSPIEVARLFLKGILNMGFGEPYPKVTTRWVVFWLLVIPFFLASCLVVSAVVWLWWVMRWVVRSGAALIRRPARKEDERRSSLG